MRCINKSNTKRLLCIAMCIAVVFVSGCGTNKQQLSNAYNAYTYNNSFTNSNPDASKEYFANDLCVTEPIDFGTDKTDSQVAQGAGVFNTTTKEVVYSQNLFAKLYPASTTKILTAYIIIKDCNLDDIVTVSESAADQASDSSVCGLRAGDRISVNDLLYGLMLNSGNDAAEALAEYHSGSVEEFAVVMTNEAKKLGASNSNFKNPSGLPDEEHYTTVYDMYLIFNKAISEEKFVEIIHTSERNATYYNANGDLVEKKFHNTNRYLNGTVETPDGIEVIGGKTGTTFAAGYCLVLYSKNSVGDDIISIVFKADGKYNLYLLMNQILSKFAN